MHTRNALLIQTGNFDDDLDEGQRLRPDHRGDHRAARYQAGAVREAREVVAPHAIIASNTSGLRIADMLAGPQRAVPQELHGHALLQPAALHEAARARRRSGHQRRGEAAASRRSAEELLGKGIVWGKDTPNFIGNRIGVQSMMTTIHLMLEKGLAPEDVDAITGIADGAPEERDVPHRGHRRPRHRRPRRRRTATRRSIDDEDRDDVQDARVHRAR